MWQCAHGSTSLESFHLHLARFIPGTSANAVNFQAYLMEGITRWNVLRAKEAIDSPSHPLRTFDSRLQHKVCYHQTCTAYPTGKFPQPVSLGRRCSPISSHQLSILVKPLGFSTSISSLGLICKDEDLDQLIDEGFEDFTEEDSNNTATVVPSGVDTILVPPSSDTESNDEEEVYNNNNNNTYYVIVIAQLTGIYGSKPPESEGAARG